MFKIFPRTTIEGVIVEELKKQFSEVISHLNHFWADDPFENDIKSIRVELEWWREDLPEILCMFSMLNRRQALWSLVRLNWLARRMSSV